MVEDGRDQGDGGDGGRPGWRRSSATPATAVGPPRGRPSGGGWGTGQDGPAGHWGGRLTLREPMRYRPATSARVSVPLPTAGPPQWIGNDAEAVS